MKKEATNLFMTTLTALAFSSAIASPVCNEITNYRTSSSGLIPVLCSDRTYKASNTLINSGQFPDVSFLDICYVSDPIRPISLNIGNLPVTIKSISMWTNNFDTFGVPLLFKDGTSNVATVATQLTITERNGRSVGKLFTKDIINLSPLLNTPPGPTPEDNIIIGGTNLLATAKGTLKLSSSLNPNGSVGIISITGKICTN
jgi:hypothetical protein